MGCCLQKVPDRFYADVVFKEEEATYKDVAEAANQLLQEQSLDDNAKATLI